QHFVEVVTVHQHGAQGGKPCPGRSRPTAEVPEQGDAKRDVLFGLFGRAGRPGREADREGLQGPGFCHGWVAPTGVGVVGEGGGPLPPGWGARAGRPSERPARTAGPAPYSTV